LRVLLGALEGADRNGHVLYLRVGEREHALPLRVGGRGEPGFEVLEAAGKTEIGPRNIPWLSNDVVECIVQAINQIILCRETCDWCYHVCVYLAVRQLFQCVSFAMF
jgi:hypothetical protein